MTTMQGPVVGIIILKCDPDWDPCQKKQAKAKAKAINEKCPLNRKKGISSLDANGVSNRMNGNDAAKAYKNEFKDIAAGKTPKPRVALPKNAKFHPGHDGDVADPCMRDQVKDGKIPKRAGRKPPQDGWQADHIVDMQWGGRATGPMWMMDADVNESLGRQMCQKPNASVDQASGCTTEGCD